MAAASNRDEEIVFASKHHGFPHVGNARTLHDESGSLSIIALNTTRALS
ncbi:MAG: hypothetical protein LC804_24945 [Acidobacteria bacterium]|nr:hypothetical protein [Acidobacteriota bacterium]